VSPGRPTVLYLATLSFLTVRYSTVSRSDPCTHHPSNRHTHRPKPSTCPSKPRNEPACVNTRIQIWGLGDTSRPLTETTYIFSLSSPSRLYHSSRSASNGTKTSACRARLFCLLSSCARRSIRPKLLYLQIPSSPRALRQCRRRAFLSSPHPKEPPHR
jgi:hypothetical protein